MGHSRGAGRVRLVVHGFQRFLFAANDEEIVSVDDGDVGVVRTTEGFHLCLAQPDDRLQSRVAAAGFVHRFGAEDGEPQYFLRLQQSGAAPRGEFTHAVTCQHRRFR